MPIDRSDRGLDDMVLLSSISKKDIAKNLKTRHAKDIIYTNIGHVLVVVVGIVTMITPYFARGLIVQLPKHSLST